MRFKKRWLAGFLLALGCQSLGPSRGPAGDCAVCKWLVGKNQERSVSDLLQSSVDKEKLCADPYGAVGGRPEVEKALGDLVKSWQDKFRENLKQARAAYSQTFGYYDFNDYFFEDFRRRGAVVNEEALKGFLTAKYAKFDESGSPGTLNSGRMAYCKDELGGFDVSSYKLKDLAGRMPELNGRINRFVSHWKPEFASMIKIIPLVFIEKLSDKCKDIRTKLQDWRKDAKNQLSQPFFDYVEGLGNLPLCKNSLQLRMLAAEITRRDTIEFTDQELREVVEPYLPLFQFASSAYEFDSYDGEATDSIQTFLVEKAKYKDTCSFLGTFDNAYTEHLFNSMQDDMKKSKDYIEALTTGYNSAWYTRKETLNSAFEISKTAVSVSLASLTKDQSLIDQLRGEVAKVTLAWPEPSAWPQVEKPNWAGKTTRYVDEAALDPNDPYWPLMSTIGDADLNAFYVPNLRQVFVNPVMVWMSDKLPMALFGVLTHEVGHDIDAGNERNGKISLPVLSGPLKCMGEKTSIQLKPVQWREASADIFATLADAYLMRQLEAKDRVLYAAESFSFFHVASVEKSSYAFSGSHPFDVFRVSGVTGASASFREALDCQAKSNYVTCF